MKAIGAVSFSDVMDGLEPGIYDARLLNPPSGPDCKGLIVREDGTLGWCFRDGTQSEDGMGRVSTFAVAELLADDR